MYCNNYLTFCMIYITLCISFMTFGGEQDDSTYETGVIHFNYLGNCHGCIHSNFLFQRRTANLCAG